MPSVFPGSNCEWLFILVYYASGCSIAKFPEDGIVITQTFKDQGTEYALHMLFGFSFSFFLIFNHSFITCKSPTIWRRAWQLTLVFLPGEHHGQRSLVGYSLWDRTELGTAEVTWHTCTYSVCVWSTECSGRPDEQLIPTVKR